MCIQSRRWRHFFYAGKATQWTLMQSYCKELRRHVFDACDATNVWIKQTADRNDLYICTKKAVIIFINIKIKRKTIKTIILKIKSLNKTKLGKKYNRHLGTEPGSPGHKSTTLTTELRGPSLQNFWAQNLWNAWIDLKTNFIFWSVLSVSIE